MRVSGGKVLQQHMLDIRDVEELEIHIDHSGSRVWINSEDGCLLRAYKVKKIELVDDRPKTGQRE